MIRQVSKEEKYNWTCFNISSLQTNIKSTHFGSDNGDQAHETMQRPRIRMGGLLQETFTLYHGGPNINETILHLTNECDQKAASAKVVQVG